MVDFNTVLIFLVLLFNTTVSEFIRTGISELIVKPIAMRQGRKVLESIKGGSETLKKTWDKLDYTLPEGVGNILNFLSDSESYIWDTVIPEVPELEGESEEVKELLVDYLVKNWSQEKFLKKVNGLFE